MSNRIKTAFGTHYIAGICQVTRHTVARWIAKGKLVSFVTGGGQRRVWAADLVAFLKSHHIPVPAELLALCGLKILIVDDEPEVRRIAVRIIGDVRPTAEIFEADNGFDAGRMTAAVMPTLVLLDIRLPGIDGLEICRTIRREPRLRGIKILAMTGYDVEESKKAVLAAGADDFLAKPFRPSALAEKLEFLLGAGATADAPTARPRS